MDDNLANSIYLKEEPALSDSPPGRSKEEIFWEQYEVGSINQSSKKHSIAQYHPEQTQEYVPLPNIITKQYFTGQTQSTFNKTLVFDRLFQSKKKKTQKRIFERPNTHRPVLWDTLPPLPAKQESQIQIKNRNLMSQNAAQRVQQKMKNLKNAVQQRVAFEMQNESSVKDQMEIDQEIRNMRIQSFLERQLFLQRQRQILREMRQFCEYGSIRLRHMN